MNKLLRYILHLFFPNRCPFCRNCISVDEHCCADCSEEFVAAEGIFMTNCREAGSHYDTVVSPFSYEGKASQAVKDLKFYGWEQHAEHLGYYLYQSLIAHDVSQFDIVGYVPMQKKKQRKRGFNQAKRLAKVISKLSGKPLTDSLVKIRETEEQHTLSEKKRRANLKGAFRVEDASEIEDKTVLLIDDVFTTGSTANECAKILRKSGAANITVATVCAVKQNRAG